MSGQMARQRLHTFERLGLVGGAAHGLEHARAGVLEGDVEIGEEQALGHQRDDRVDVRIGIDVVKAHPGAELAEFLGEVGNVAGPGGRFHWLGVVDVDAVGGGVLADDQQFLGAGRDQAFRPRAARAAAGREARSPRIWGMMQKEQRWLQPSEIFR